MENLVKLSDVIPMLNDYTKPIQIKKLYLDGMEHSRVKIVHTGWGNRFQIYQWHAVAQQWCTMGEVRTPVAILSWLLTNRYIVDDELTKE